MTRLSPGDLVDLEARIIEEREDSEDVRRSRYRQLGVGARLEEMNAGQQAAVLQQVEAVERWEAPPGSLAAQGRRRAPEDRGPVGERRTSLAAARDSARMRH